jgi:hypothetical protein
MKRLPIEAAPKFTFYRCQPGGDLRVLPQPTSTCGIGDIVSVLASWEFNTSLASR